MSSPVKRVKRSLSMKLALFLLLVVMAIFLLSLGFLSVNARHIVSKEAVRQASHELDNTALRVQNCIEVIENSTINTLWVIRRNPNPDSLLQYTRRLVTMNPEVAGCSITMEKDYYPEMDYGFSAYSVRQGDSVATVREGDYNYYLKVWYTTPRRRNKACWVDPFNDFNAGTLYNHEMIASYCVPLHDGQERFIGVIATDLSLKWLDKLISQEQKYKNSYCMVLGADGHYILHPDSTMIIKHTIFGGLDPSTDADKLELGNRMTDRQSGYMTLDMDGVRSTVVYRPIPGTQWSIAMVCPVNELLSRYLRLHYILFPLLLLVAILVILGSRSMAHRITLPVRELSAKLKAMEKGKFNTLMPDSKEESLAGLLKSSFAAMQNSISISVNNAEKSNMEAREKLIELEQATIQAQQASRQKSDFMQDISHQFRTPLNIILGFAQVLRDGYGSISEEEKKEIAREMHLSSKQLEHMVRELLIPSRVGDKSSVKKEDDVSCLGIAKTAQEDACRYLAREGSVRLENSVSESCHVTTNREHLLFILTELLVNALRSSPDAQVVLRVMETRDNIIFEVEDRGPGIPADKMDFVFEKFTKLDTYANGLGLGLYLVYELCRRIDGKLSLDKNYTAGCRFSLELSKGIDRTNLAPSL